MGKVCCSGGGRVNIGGRGYFINETLPSSLTELSPETAEVCLDAGRTIASGRKRPPKTSQTI